MDAQKRLARKAHAAGTDWALGIDARSRALLSEDELAEGPFLEAIDHLSRTWVRAELARTRLLYGERLRRMNRRVDARTQLRIADDNFIAMGMQGFAQRAGRELLATGETVRKRTAETRDVLTPQELQIAELARDGLSNPDIGARLFPQPAHRGVAPAPRVRQAGNQIPPGAGRHAQPLSDTDSVRTRVPTGVDTGASHHDGMSP